MVNIMKIASAKSQSTRGACHQSTFMGNNLTISETCLLFLRSRWLNVLNVRTPFDSEGLLKMLWDLYDGSMETVEYIWQKFGAWYTGLLDFVTELQKYTSLAYSVLTNEEYIKWDAVVPDGDEVYENSNPLPGLTFDSTT